MHLKKSLIVSSPHSFAFFMLFAIVVFAVPELNRSIGHTSIVSAATSSVVSSASDSIAIYPWNLSDGGQPLISLPDHVGAGVDLSLSYSMDQFEFPLFQSIYYKKSARKYILMVIAKQGRRAQFIDLSVAQSVSSGLKFLEKGDS